MLRNTLKKISGVATVLWTLVPKLDLDNDTINTSELSADDDDDEEEDEREIMFAHILSSVLAQQEFMFIVSLLCSIYLMLCDFNLECSGTTLEIFILPRSRIWSNWTLMFLLVTGQCYKTCSKMLLI